LAPVAPTRVPKLARRAVVPSYQKVLPGVTPKQLAL
jgi:hypothetical protein